MSETREQKLEDLRERLTLINTSLFNAGIKLKSKHVVPAGTILGLKDEKKKLETEIARLESSPEAAAPASSSASSSPAPLPGGEGAPPSGEEEEEGIPRRLRTKRPYPITPAVIEQRKKAAQARRPGSEGNMRNWKGGLHAQNFIQGRIKPCQSTCPLFDECELVSDGKVKPGDACLDKQAVIVIYSTIMEAIKNKRYDDFNEVSGLMVAEMYHTCQILMEDIFRDGSVVKREKFDKDGKIHTIEYVSHPSLNALPKLIADLGLTPRELNITPKAVADNENDKEQGKTLAGLMSDLNRRQREQKGGKDPEEDE